MNEASRTIIARALRAMADDIEGGRLNVMECTTENEMREKSRSQLGLTLGREMELTGVQFVTIKTFRPADAPPADPEVMRLMRGMYGGSS